MATVTVPALKPLTYQGRSYVRGELVTLPAIEAAARARRGEVSLTRGHTATYQTRDVAAVPDTVTVPAARTKRHYRRRDLTAESGAE